MAITDPALTLSSIHEVFPYLIVRGAAAAIDFYRKTFGAEEMFRLTDPNGRIGHAQLKFGSAVVMLAEEFPERGVQSPLALGGTGTRIHLHVDNVDTLAERAVDNGALIVSPPTDQFYGERTCCLRDPFGHEWLLGHQIESVSPEDMQKRYETMRPK
jgi:uncharacterized glyoxalase superfamily protein PhnB